MHVVCYDIADPKRLRRVSRLMERHATLPSTVIRIDKAGRPHVPDSLDPWCP